MPRRPRLDAPGAYQHVVVRGVAGRAIFGDDQDRHELARRLAKVLPESDSTCLAWSFMGDHVQLVLQTGDTPISRVMARIWTGYAMYFNDRHLRTGYLVQNRFRSRLVPKGADLLTMICDVHLSPLGAGLVPSLDVLERFRWCGYAAFLGGTAEEFHDPAAALALYGSTVESAREAIRSLMRASLEQDEEPEPDPLAALVAQVCRELGLDREELTASGPQRVRTEARQQIVLRASRAGLASKRKIGEAVGLSPSGVSKCLRRLESRARRRA